MLLRISVTFRCRGVEEAGAIFFGDLKRVDCTGRADEKRFGPQTIIVGRAGGRSEIEDEADFTRIEWLADVLIQEGETRLTGQVSNVLEAARCQIICADYFVASGK
jgi:hypothetical protein